jgi:hypothetical protein
MQNQATNTTQKRLRILGDDEIEALYGRPHFTDDERLEYFSLSPTEKSALEQLHSIKSRIYFILQLGYFKSHHMFFVFDLPEVEEDVQYVQGHYFSNSQLDDLDITKVTRLRQQGLILNLFSYRSCDADQRQALAEKARQAATVSAKPIYIFRELMHFMAEQRIVAPGYTFMQDTVGQALTHEQERLTTILSQYLSPSDVENLNRLLEDSPGLYEITQLKREPRDFSASEIKREIRRGEQIEDLYNLAQKLLPELKISNESIKYYASLVSYYSVFRLKQLNERTVHIYLLCFVYHRYQKLHDNLINCSIYNVRRYRDGAKEAAKDRVYELRTEGNKDLDKAAQVLKLFTDDGIPQQTSFHEVQAKAFSILEAHKIDFVADHLTRTVTFDERAFQWEHIDDLAHQFKRHLRPVLQSVEWAASAAQAPLIEAVRFLKDAFEKGRPLSQYPAWALPLRFIPDTAKRYLYAPGANGHRQLLSDRYEFLVYRLLRHGLEAGNVFCRDSVSFRSFEDDLLDDEAWQDKDKLIDNTGLPCSNSRFENIYPNWNSSSKIVLSRSMSGLPQATINTSRPSNAAHKCAGPFSIPKAVSPLTIPFSTASNKWTSAACYISSIDTAPSWRRLIMCSGATPNKQRTNATLPLAWWPGAPTWDSVGWETSPTLVIMRFPRHRIILSVWKP